jgi:phospho-N-acetylmuramoyl-pentapeptide-transferase
MEVRRNNIIEEVNYHQVETKSTKTTIPFLKNNNFDYAKLVDWAGEYKVEAAWLVFVLMTIFVVTAVSNGANLTDGLDGLAAGSSAIIGVALGVLAYMSSHFEFASFLNIMFIPGAEELVVFAAAFIGATVGFLWYNSYPAQVFMGDTGSLTLGGIIAVFAIIIRKELLLYCIRKLTIIDLHSILLQ